MRSVLAAALVGLAHLEGVVAQLNGRLPGPPSRLSHALHRNATHRLTSRSTADPEYLSSKTQKFWVNGTSIPEVEFDIGESYAGLLPISKDPEETRQLYFWFIPTTGDVKDELTIWLNGGPGCSSLEGFFQENGPISWQWGKIKPEYNKYAWSNLTNMLWVEQPVGTGYSQGIPSVTSAEEVAEQFSGFLENFIETFDFYNKKLYVTGESYAGAFVPHILDNLYDKNNKTLFDPRGLIIYNPYMMDLNTHINVPVLRFIEQNRILFPIEDAEFDTLKALDERCGYSQFLEDSLVFPPKGKYMPPAERFRNVDCNLWDQAFDMVLRKNPCFNCFLVTTTCPVLHCPLGFPGSFPYTTPGTEIYFNRTDVKKAINAPDVNWQLCTDTPIFVDGTDYSDPPAWGVLPRVIDKNERSIVGSGLFDFVVPDEGTLLAIQNMTWGGQQGFQNEPSKQYYVPYDNQGVIGVTHTERKLTYIRMTLAGHMVPQFQPGAAYMQLEYLLGRRDEI